MKALLGPRRGSRPLAEPMARYLENLPAAQIKPPSKAKPAAADRTTTA
jgi:hypothetical protein